MNPGTHSVIQTDRQIIVESDLKKKKMKFMREFNTRIARMAGSMYLPLIPT